jgi:hypothetical protein
MMSEIYFDATALQPDVFIQSRPGQETEIQVVTYFSPTPNPAYFVVPSRCANVMCPTIAASF